MHITLSMFIIRNHISELLKEASVVSHSFFHTENLRLIVYDNYVSGLELKNAASETFERSRDMLFLMNIYEQN